MKNWMLTLLALGAIVCAVPTALAQHHEYDKLFPDDGAVNAGFGVCVASDNGVIAIGRPWGEDNGSSAGSAYLFAASTGAQIDKLLPLGGASNDSFGVSIAVGDGVVVVGANTDSTNGQFSGAAYLFDVSTGMQIAKLVASDAEEWRFFGISTAIANGVVAVGSHGSGDFYDYQSGSVYLFDAATGAQIGEPILPSDGTDLGIRFGQSVAIDNGILAVGAPEDADNGSDSGSAYLFNATTGALIAKLLASDGATYDQFGSSIAIDNGVVAVGSKYGDGRNSGSVYLFDASTGAPIGDPLVPGGAPADDWFGWSIAIDNGAVAVGAMGDDINGNNSGVAYLFDASTGDQIGERLIPSDGVAGDAFGRSVSIDNGVVAVGVPGHDDDNNGDNSGSVYLFDNGRDTDGDGLLDDWEINGIPYDKADGTTGRYILDSTGNGLTDAHPLYKDLFIELDSMTGLNFLPSAVQDVEFAFRDAPVDNPPDDDGYIDTGIKIHIVVDESDIPFEQVIQFPPGGDWPMELAVIKWQWFGTVAEQQDPDTDALLAAKAKAYRYCIMVNRLMDADGKDFGGNAELPGADFVMAYSSGSRTWLASTFMHELGHNLNLMHGGADDINMKPNYPSIMNYILTVPQPWSKSFWKLDYSHEELAPLFEDNLDENTSVGDGGGGHYRNWFMPYFSVVTDGAACYSQSDWGQPFVAYTSLDPAVQGVDYNLDCDTDDPSVQADLNYLQASGLPGSEAPSPGDTLIGQNDWDRIELPIPEGNGDFADAPAENELTDEGRQFIRDNFPTPPDICEADWNHDDTVNTLDFLAFLNEWTAEHYRADLNLDGDINTLDFLEFLNLWVAGCP